MAKSSLSGQLNMYDFFKEPSHNEDGSLKDTEMVSFTPDYREDELEVIDFDKDLDLAPREKSESSKESKKEAKKDAKSVLKEADQLISDMIVKPRQTDEEIWIEEQMAMRKKRKSKAKSIDEQNEFVQESLFAETNFDKKKTDKQESPKKKEIGKDRSIQNAEAVMERCFLDGKGQKLVLAYVNYNKVYESFPEKAPVIYSFLDTSQAVSYYVDRMHELQGRKDLREAEERPALEKANLIPFEN